MIKQTQRKRLGYQNSFDVEVTERDARLLVPIILSIFKTKPSSLLDVGGGIGIWCQEFLRHGVKDVICLDHPSSSVHSRIEQIQFIPIDFNKLFPNPIKKDIAICIELAEHLSVDRAPDLINFITNSADIAIFSAAIPQQGGDAHLNERPPAYWKNLFIEHTYICLDILRPLFINNKTISYWYRQNMFIFANSRGIAQLKNMSIKYNSIPDDFELVYKSILERYREASNPSIRRAIALLIMALHKRFTQKR